MGPIGRTSQGPLAAFQADCEGLWGRAFVRNEIVCRNQDYLRLCEKMHMHLFCFSVGNRGVPVQPVTFSGHDALCYASGQCSTQRCGWSALLSVVGPEV